MFPVQGLRMAIDKHTDDNTHNHLLLLGALVETQRQQIASLTIRLSQVTPVNDGTLVWRIANFSQRLTEAKNKGTLELKSEPFLTSRYGYRMGASVFPDGNGSGEGNHVSVYIRMLPGSYDNILEWPFRFPVSFRLLDQCSDPEKQQDVFESFLPNPTWKHFEKPDRNSDSMGFGYPKFVSHDVLKSGTYIKDDVIFLKISVQQPSPYIVPSSSGM